MHAKINNTTRFANSNENILMDVENRQEVLLMVNRFIFMQQSIIIIYIYNFIYIQWTIDHSKTFDRDESNLLINS